MGEIRVAIAGVGNCASALVQGVYYYKNVKEEEFVPGLLHINFGGYYPRDIRFVAAFDINQEKVGNDLGDAIYAPPNNTPVFYKVPKLGVTVKRAPILDGLGKFCKPIIKVASSEKVVDVAEELRKAKADLLLNYVPVGSERAARFYAKAAIEAGCAFINCMPSFIASVPFWQRKFQQADLPVAGDDVMSQIGATVLHKTIAKLFVDRGVKIDESYQLNVGGDTDFLNMLDETRLMTKRESKTSAVQAMVPYPVPLRIGPSDYIDFLKNIKICYISMKGKYFGDTPVKLDLKLEVVDAPNSAGVIIDAIRATKIALDRGISGPLISISAYAFKHPPVHAPYEVAKTWVKDFLEGKRDR
ncbi:inositol-3-phosphate synthase [Candidatus Bathyarchaeota archaeon]|nr:inositol-3-phosphate synthase [Candidatus Bathyarchaeota archaeon]